MLLGMEFVAREIRFYTIFEAVYLTKPSEAADQLANTLVKTYSNLLKYLAQAYRYYSKHTACKHYSSHFVRKATHARNSAGGIGTLQ
jgi:hypothetical protein